MDTMINLDQMRAPSRRVLFLGVEFEIGYIPCGLAIPLVANLNTDIKNQTENDSVDRLRADNIRQISIFCSYYDAIFTEKYIADHATVEQVVAFYQLIMQAIVTNFSAGVGDTDETDQTAEKKTGMS